ncbi:MAG TPA: transposase [Noviherbaspirillum sp.]
MLDINPVFVYHSSMTTSSQSGVKFRAQPRKAMQDTLNQWIGCQRVIYNGKVAEDRYFASLRRLHLRDDPNAECKTPLDQKYSQFKTELTSWLAHVPSQILRNGAYRWMGAKQRQLAGLAQRPVMKRAFGRQSVMITKELFRFVPIMANNPEAGHRLILGTETHPIGALPFIAHRPYQIPNTITVSREAGMWFVSFSYAVEAPEMIRSQEELAYEFSLLDDDDLFDITNAYDRGVTVPLAAADGAFHGMDPVVVDRIRKKEIKARRYQRKMARQVVGSKNRDKTKMKLARTRNYQARAVQDWAHKTSYQLVNGSTKVHVFEQLLVKQMTKKPKARMENGKWLKNGARAKAGLSSAILRSGWGRVRTYTTYKAARRNQLVIAVPPHCTSQECCRCGYIHPDNRSTQSRFVCQRCGHTENADTNAAKVQKKRGIALLREGVKAKPVKRAAVRCRNDPNVTGAGCSNMSVERSNKTKAGLQTLSAHAAMKQKNDGREARNTGL